MTKLGVDGREWNNRENKSYRKIMGISVIHGDREDGNKENIGLWKASSKTEWGIWKEKLKAKEIWKEQTNKGGSDWFCAEWKQSNEVLMYGLNKEMKSEQIKGGARDPQQGPMSLTQSPKRSIGLNHLTSPSPNRPFFGGGGCLFFYLCMENGQNTQACLAILAPL